jgi:hypothetical protein
VTQTSTTPTLKTSYLVPIILEKFEAFQKKESLLLGPIARGRGRGRALQGRVPAIILKNRKLTKLKIKLIK